MRALGLHSLGGGQLRQTSTLARAVSLLPTSAVLAPRLKFPGILRAGAPPPKKGDTEKKGRGADEEGGDDDDDDDSGPDMSRISRVALHTVAGITVVSVVLYYFTLPSGTPVTWDKLVAKSNDLVDISLYSRYAQVQTGKDMVYVGLNPEDVAETQAAVDMIEETRTSAAPLRVSYVGYSYSESALAFVAVAAWVFPFLFTPLYVTFLSQATGTALRSALKAMGRQQGGDDKTANAAKLFKVTQQTHVKFSDIAGMVEPKHEVAEIVDFLKNPDRYVKMGAKIPSGAMLLGPPGTGKTLLAKAVAGESTVAFIPCVGSDFVEMWVGMGALRVRKLFELAKKQEKCIIYIDEIDAIGLKRGTGMGGEKQEQEHTLNELLTQLDGFNSANDRIIVLASSNVEQSQLDPALIRPGRFDRLVHVESPVIAERIDIFKYHLGKLRLVADTPEPANTAADAQTADTDNAGPEGGRPMPVVEESKVPTPDTTAPFAAAEVLRQSTKVPVDGGQLPDAAAVGTSDIAPGEAKKEGDAQPPSTSSEIVSVKQEGAPEVDAPSERDSLIGDYAKRMSDLCPGFVGADIANVCNEAAILAAREEADVVGISHLERSIDRVLAGIEQRSRVLSDFEKNVVAHHEAGHAVAGWFLNRADPLMKVSIVPRGGKALGYAQYLPNENMQRSADDIIDSICVTLGGRVAEKIFFDHLSTGASDDLQKVTRMAYSHVASFNRSSAYAAPGSSSTSYTKPFGESTGKAMDDAAKTLVDRAYQRTYDLLLSHKADMEKLAERLLKNEVLTHADVVELLGPRPPKQSERRCL
jgi:AFG3 family protein